MALHTPDQVVMRAYGQWREAERIHKAWLEAGKVAAGGERVREGGDGGRVGDEERGDGGDEICGDEKRSMDGGDHTDCVQCGDTKEPTEIPPDSKSCTGIPASKINPNHTGQLQHPNTPTPTPTPKNTPPEGKLPDLLGKEGAFFIVMHGFIRQTREPWTPTMFTDALEWQRDSISEQLNLNDITDKGKASTLAKLVVIAQASWLIIQLIARRAADLPMSLLELHVAIHILIAGVVYLFWWNKPLDVYEPITLNYAYGPVPPRPERIRRKKGLLDIMDTFPLLRRWRTPTFPSGEPEAATPPVASDARSQTDGGASTVESFGEDVAHKDITDILGDNWQALIFYLIYAGLHATAWNSQFPTVVECWLWRCSCLVVGAVPIGLVMLMFFEKFCRTGSVLTRCKQAVYHTLKILYLIGSGCLLVESFVSLRCMPSGAYKTVVWENYIPHF